MEDWEYGLVVRSVKEKLPVETICLLPVSVPSGDADLEWVSGVNSWLLSLKSLTPAANGARCSFEILGLVKNDEDITTFSKGQMVHTVVGRPEAGFLTLVVDSDLARAFDNVPALGGEKKRKRKAIDGEEGEPCDTSVSVLVSGQEEPQSQGAHSSSTGTLVAPSTPLGAEFSPAVLDPDANGWHDGVEFPGDETLGVEGSPSKRASGPLGKWFRDKDNVGRYANFKTTTSDDMAAAMGLCVFCIPAERRSLSRSTKSGWTCGQAPCRYAWSRNLLKRPPFDRRLESLQHSICGCTRTRHYCLPLSRVPFRLGTGRACLWRPS
jgi:hypothetical protein